MQSRISQYECYKCSLIQAVKTAKFGDVTPLEIIDLILEFIPNIIFQNIQSDQELKETGFTEQIQDIINYVGDTKEIQNIIGDCT